MTRLASQRFLLWLLPLLLRSAPAVAAADAGTLTVDALLAKVGRESVLMSDLRRFSEVEEVLVCAELQKAVTAPSRSTKARLDAYIEEELLYQEARAKKIGTAGQIPLAVQQIQNREKCRTRWRRLGELYGKLWGSSLRPREGESMLVRELERRILVDKFRKSELIPDLELWKREVSSRIPVKNYLE